MLGFSALQRAEIAEIAMRFFAERLRGGFSALQRAEIAEIRRVRAEDALLKSVSVLFNEPKLLKSTRDRTASSGSKIWFQCSSTSRNC